jgi:hypothetical protein
MNSTEPPDEQLAAAETRLASVLPLLRNDPQTPEPPPTEKIVRAARWERSVRTTAHAIAAFALAVADATALLLRRADARERER